MIHATTLLIGKELKTKDLHHTAAERASGPTTKPNPKPESKPRIASAKGRVKPLARLLRCATALRVTAPRRGSCRPSRAKMKLDISYVKCIHSYLRGVISNFRLKENLQCG